MKNEYLSENEYLFSCQNKNFFGSREFFSENECLALFNALLEGDLDRVNALSDSDYSSMHDYWKVEKDKLPTFFFWQY